MLKPLLRTIPNLSGNVKLVCPVDDCEKLDNQNYIAYVQDAKLLPLSTSLNQKTFSVNLLESSYEFDLKRFYTYYHSNFYKTMFDYDKNDFIKYDSTISQNQRNTDFEMGAKRISYKKNGYQFEFYAPIYIDNVNDIPDFFEIKIKIKNQLSSTYRNFKINICANNTNSKNHLYEYLKTYTNKIDDNFVHILETTKQATFFGIKCATGSFVRIVDNHIHRMFDEQMTSNNFDNLITSGWARNGMVIKQIIPLCFCFNINDLFEDSEFVNSEFTIEGAYYKDNVQLEFYDFSYDYSEYFEDVLKFDTVNGIMDYVTTNKNLMRGSFPALNEADYFGYRYSNKLSTLYNRWKLKYSSDEHPYITNMNHTFSTNQDSIYKYNNYPEMFMSIHGISNVNNNFIVPVGNLRKYDSSPYKSKITLIDTYDSIMNKYTTTWYHLTRNVNDYYGVKLRFVTDIKDNAYYYYDNDLLQYVEYDRTVLYNTVKDIEDYNKGKLPSDEKCIWVFYKKNIWDNYKWVDVNDNKAFFRGILYNFKTLIDSYPVEKHIDKWAVFVKLDFEPFPQNLLNTIKTAKYSILTNDSNINNANCTVSELVMQQFPNGVFNESVNQFFVNESSYYRYKHEITDEPIYIENKNGSGEFIDLVQYGFYYYDINKYYKVFDVKRNLSVNDLEGTDINTIFNYYENVNTVDGYELLPIYYPDYLYSDREDKLGNKFQFTQKPHTNSEWLMDALCFSDGACQYKTEFLEETFDKYAQANQKYVSPLYLRAQFISEYELKYIICSALQLDKVKDAEKIERIVSKFSKLRIYDFNPIVNCDSKKVAINVFVHRDKYIGRTYGDIIPTKDLYNDRDLIYVDPYNVNIMIKAHNENEKWKDNLHLYTDDITTIPSDANPDDYFVLTDGNSQEIFAHILNKQHFHYFFRPLFNNQDNSLNENDVLDMLYIKNRYIVNDYNNHDLHFKDLYIKLLDLYEEPDFSNESNPVAAKTLWLSDVVLHIMDNLLFDSSCWKFSKSFIESHRNNLYTKTKGDNNETNSLYSLLCLPDTFDIAKYRFDIVFKKRFIKLNDELFKLMNMDDNNEWPYKDLYLYTIQKPYDYHTSHKMYFTDNISLLNCTYETTQCLEPLFDKIIMQQKKETAVYKEYYQSRISETSYMYAPNKFGKYYRYMGDNTLVMFDIKDYENYFTDGSEAYPIKGHSPYDNKLTYYFSNSYVTSYLMETGFDLLDKSIVDSKGKHINELNEYIISYDMIDNSYSYLSKAQDIVTNKEQYVAYSYVDYSRPLQGEHTSTALYTKSRFDRIFKNRQVDYTVDENGLYKVTTKSAYIYYPDVEVKRERITYNITEYDDLGLFEQFGINTYICSYDYTYYTIETNQHVQLITAPNGEFTSYETSYLTQDYVPHIGTSYCTYGFYFINAHVDNTRGSFKIVDEDFEKKKFFTQLDGTDVYDTNVAIDICNKFNMYIPFSKLNLIKTLTLNNKLIVKPSIFKIPNIYINKPMINDTGYTYSYDIITSLTHQKDITLERYTDSLSPVLCKRSNIYNSYNLKFKNIDINARIAANNNILYSTNENIYQYNPVRIYNTTGTAYETVIPLEYKHFNSNHFINLEEEFTIEGGNRLTVVELEIVNNEENIIKSFKNYINMHNKNKFNDDEILFLYNKYNVKTDVDCVGLNASKTLRIYNLTHKFTLL